MTSRLETRLPWSSEAGYTLTELLVSVAIMLVVTGAIFSLVNPAQGSAQVQPEIADL
jgi:prepilin-type N-terminal cleavage/methylation domain-containing protein